MKLWVNEKHNITNAEEMKKASDSHSGIKSCQTAVCKISKDRHGTSAKWEGIRLLNNFELRDTEICAWKAYGIGTGKDFNTETMGGEFQENTSLEIVKDFEPAQELGTICH